MALILLFVAFLCSLFGLYEFLHVYFTAGTAEAFYAAGTGVAWALIPYLIGKTLSEMVAIRQRHLQLEQLMQQQAMLGQMLAERQTPPPPVA